MFGIIITSPCYTNAQDTIVKNNNELVFGKISEISPTEIKYKKFNFQDGPTYTEMKSDIRMIKYANGLKEEFQAQQADAVSKPTESNTDYYGGATNRTAPVIPDNKIDMFGNYYRYQGRRIKESEMHDILFQSKNKKAILLAGNAKDAKAMQYVGFGAIPLGIVALYFLLYS